MNRKDQYDYFEKGLQALYSQSEIITILKELNHYKVFEEISELEVLQRLQKQEPYQYIAKKCYFYDIELKLDKHTLIPRPETEELIYWIVQNNILEKPKILDIGTGSGCIALTLAKHIKSSEVSAIDVSSEALKIVEENADDLALNVRTILLDILMTNKLDQKYDIIVSNPPYIPNKEKDLMHSNVLNYEPHLALFVEDKEPLIFYEKIANLARKFLLKNGRLYFECNEYYASEVKKMLLEKGYSEVHLEKDMQAKERMIMALL